MRGLLFIISILLFIGCSPNLRQLVEENETEKIVEWRNSQGYDWSDGWILDSSQHRDIDHHIYGVILVWSKTEGEINIQRTEYFHEDETLYSMTEVIHSGDLPFSSTRIHFKPNKRIYYKKTQYGDSSLERHFVLALYKDNQKISSYRSSSYHIDLINLSSG